ncbi:MAG TPA: spore coat U domain-containing protein [Rhizomicrobium sp.]|nr:spore coat U domain-containing protein [Rhizomicrobium sp.]
MGIILMANVLVGDERGRHAKSSAKRFLLGLALGTFAAALSGSGVDAATATATFTVTANVLTTCFVQDNNLNFGSYTAALLTGTTTITAACTTGTPYTLGLDQGTFPGATVTTRGMTGTGVAPLNYGLFQDAAHTINWGNTPGVDTVAGTGTGTNQTFSVFGQIPAGQGPSPGAYSDTITVTLTF